MSIVRINEFPAQVGRGGDLHDLLSSLAPGIAGSSGCQSCRVLRGTKERDRIVVLEEWDSVADHEAAVANIPADVIATAMAMMSGPPSGTDYDV